MKEIIITAFVSALFSAYITAKVQRYFDKKREQEKIFFDVYMKLMELEGYYFWLVSAEMREIEEPKDITRKVWRLKWEIADMVRQIEVEELKDILEILFLEKFSHSQRYQKLTTLIDKIGHKINPKYKRIMSKISKENLESIKLESMRSRPTKK